MALLTFVCKNCGHEQEELVTSTSSLHKCKKCGGDMKQSFSGKCYGFGAKGGNGGCTHNCATCSGCKK